MKPREELVNMSAEEGVHEALKKIKSIKNEISRLTAKIHRRVKEMENEASENGVIIFRNDPVISDAIIELLGLNRKGPEICARHHLSGSAYDEFRNEPKVFRHLNLSESCANARVYLKKICRAGVNPKINVKKLVGRNERLS